MSNQELFKTRSLFRETIDFLTFPIRALTLFYNDFLCFSSLASERYSYVASNVNGYCLDVGCEENVFINTFLRGNGIGIDVVKYKGLSEENIIQDTSKFPFKDNNFDTVSLITTINHIPKSKRLSEIKECYRVLKNDGNIIVTMGNPIAEILVHKLIYFYDKFLGTKLDRDNIRGMEEDEAYFLSDKEIMLLLTKAGFTQIKKKYFLTQWNLNHLFVACRENLR